jgi:carboxyl-terminal processing protease
MGLLRSKGDFIMEENQKKRTGFGSGMFVGFLLGVLLLGIGVTVGAHVYTSSTNQYLIISPSGIKQTEKSDILTNKTVKKIDELMSYIDLYYNDDYDEEDIRNAIYAGTLEGLGDPYSVYYTADEYKDMQINTSGNYYGIGAALSQDAKTKEVTISKVYEGTPAEEAGLKDGDQIIKVNDTESTSKELSALVQEIRGEEGTTVHLQVYRASNNKTFEIDVERKNVELPSITSKMLDGGIGYIQISEFQSKTDEQFKSALADLKKQGMKSLIVDVRSNPGGLINAASNILDQILPEGTVVYTEDKYGKREDYTSDSNCLDCPIAVLVNENSASASEIFAGAIKDYNYGTLIGTKTFGKGIVQTVFPLEDGDAVKITTAKYYTPKGNYIHGVGIEPDIELTYKYSGPEDEAYDMKYDNQVQKAIEVLNGEMK